MTPLLERLKSIVQFTARPVTIAWDYHHRRSKMRSAQVAVKRNVSV